MYLASICSFSHLRIVFQVRVIHFGETLGDQVKGSSPKNLKSLIEIPNVVHMKVHVLHMTEYDIYLTSVAGSSIDLSISVRFGREGKGSIPENTNIYNGRSLSMSSESTCFWLQYDPSLISVACS